MLRNQIISSVAVILTFGFFLLALPEEGFSGFSTQISCCQSESECNDTSEGPIMCSIEDELIPNAFCNKETGSCELISRISPIPTMSEWGLIAMAGILGIAGFLIVRRRKAAA